MKESNLEKFRSDLVRLIEDGNILMKSFRDAKNKHVEMASNYQQWYTEAHAVVRQLIPDRLDDFVRMYKRDKRKDIDAETYTIGDFLIGISVSRGLDVLFDGPSVAGSKLYQQIMIVKSAEKVFSSSLMSMEQLMRADVFDSELDAASELLKHKFVRAAGAVAGVVLESHLKTVIKSHNQVIKKKNPAISELNDLLKNESIIDIPTWRFIQRLGDLRNLCDHDKDREPTKEDCGELISGVDKIIKTLF